MPNYSTLLALMLGLCSFTIHKLGREVLIDKVIAKRGGYIIVKERYKSACRLFKLGLNLYISYALRLGD